jgi:hypothetical protein
VFVLHNCKHSFGSLLGEVMSDYFILEDEHGIILGELYNTDPRWGLLQYCVKWGKHTKIFKGETAYSDAQRLFYDMVLPLTHKGKW